MLTSELERTAISRGRVCQGLGETFPTLDTIDRNERGRPFPSGPGPHKYRDKERTAYLVNSPSAVDTHTCRRIKIPDACCLSTCLHPFRLAPNMRDAVSRRQASLVFSRYRLISTARHGEKRRKSKRKKNLYKPLHTVYKLILRPPNTMRWGRVLPNIGNRSFKNL